MTFKDFNLNETTLKAINNIHFVNPTSVQERCLPKALKNISFACKGKTGSGKTHCFLIPMLNGFKNDATLEYVILVPTRELGMQIYLRTKELFEQTNAKITLLVGGNDVNAQLDRVANTPSIVIGTPAKIKEIGIDNGLLNFNTVTKFIIDEADMTLEMGFLNELDAIASLLNKNTQFMVFSATIPVGIKNFINKYLQKPLLIEEESIKNDNIKHILYPSRNKDKMPILLNIIKHINPYICLIFASTREEVVSTFNYLKENGIDCEMIHGSLQARERKRNIKMALNNKFRYIVCSDIAARGIDIDGVSHVISLGFPKTDLQFYIHRSGRCGRNKYQGESITIFADRDKKSIQLVQKMGINFVFEEIKNDDWVEVKDFNMRQNRKNKQVTKLDVDIKKAVAKTRSKKVEPNYKKKVTIAVEKVKKYHKRRKIKEEIYKAKARGNKNA